MFFRCCKRTKIMQQLEETPLEDITPRASYEGVAKDSAMKDDLPKFDNYEDLCRIPSRQDGCDLLRIPFQWYLWT